MSGDNSKRKFVGKLKTDGIFYDINEIVDNSDKGIYYQTSERIDFECNTGYSNYDQQGTNYIHGVDIEDGRGNGVEKLLAKIYLFIELSFYLLLPGQETSADNAKGNEADKNKRPEINAMAGNIPYENIKKRRLTKGKISK